MAKVILRQEAIDDLNDLWIYTFDKWSEKQADKYYTALEFACTQTALTFVLPATGFLTEHFLTHTAPGFYLFGKWFIFSAVGLRLFLAGIKQVKDPGLIYFLKFI